MVRLEGGEFLMGTEDPTGFPADGEGPVRAVTLKPFWIDAYVVTNTRLPPSSKPRATLPTPSATAGRSSSGGLPDDFEPTRGAAQAPWWRQVFGASGRHPEVPTLPSSIV